MNPNHPKPTRSEQREAARAKAAELRARSQKSAARKKQFRLMGAITGGLALVAIVALIAVSAQPKPYIEPGNVQAAGGLKIGTDLAAFTKDFTPVVSPGADGEVPVLVTYVDYQCIGCYNFEMPNMAQIRQWVAEGRLALEVRPLSFLDHESLNNYSSRAANAAYCLAAESPNNFLAFHESLYMNYPDAGTAGPDNSVLIASAKEVGAKNLDAISSCINDGKYGPYVSSYTKKSLSEPIPGVSDGGPVKSTPTILMNGVRYPETGNPTNAAEFSQWVLSFLTPTK